MTINPKEAYGAVKPSMSAVPTEVLWELGAAMREGSNKYGRHNFIDKEIAASTYYDAALRHISSFWTGEDIDPDSGVPHIVKAIACLTVLRVSQIHGTIHDDRPPAAPEGFWSGLKDVVAEIDRRTPPAAVAYTQAMALARNAESETGIDLTVKDPARDRDAAAAETRARMAKVLSSRNNTKIDVVA